MADVPTLIEAAEWHESVAATHRKELEGATHPAMIAHFKTSAVCHEASAQYFREQAASR